MQKNFCKRSFSTILVLAMMLATLSITVSAGLLRYTQIDVLNSSLAINSSGLASCSGYVIPSASGTSTSLTVELQKYSSGWTKVTSWSASGTGTSSVSKAGSYTVTSGRYRVVTTAKVYSSSGSLLETQSMISSEVTY